MEKTVESDMVEGVATFEETLQRFMGLSSEEIWELQRILMRRVRCKISESLSPEGKTAMKQVKQEMQERKLELQKMALSSATLVTEIFDYGSKQEPCTVRQNGEETDIVLTAPDDAVEMSSDENQRADETEREADNNKINMAEAAGRAAEEEDANENSTKTDDAVIDSDDRKAESDITERRGDSRGSSKRGDSNRGDSMSSQRGDSNRGDSRSSQRGDSNRGDSRSSKRGDSNRGDSRSSQRGDSRSSQRGDSNRGDSRSSQKATDKVDEDTGVDIKSNTDTEVLLAKESVKDVNENNNENATDVLNADDTPTDEEGTSLGIDSSSIEQGTRSETKEG